MAARAATNAPPPVLALDFLERVASGPIPAVVVFAGEESLLAEEGIAALVARRFPDGDPAGGYVTFDAAATDPSAGDRAVAVLDEVRTSSLFGEGKVVVLKNAEALQRAEGATSAPPADADADASDVEGGEGVEEGQDADEAVAAAPRGARKPSPITALVKSAAVSPVEGATLVVSTSKPVKGKGSVSAEALTRAGAVLVDCRRLYDSVPPWRSGVPPFDTEASRWVARRAQRAHGKTMDLRAAHALVVRSGGGLSALARALETLATYAGERSSIGDDDVAKVVGRDRDDPAWVFADAVLDRDVAAALDFLDGAFTRGIPDFRGRTVVRPEAIFPALFAPLHAAYRRVMLVAEAAGRGEDPRGLATLAGLPGFVVDRVVAQARARDPEDLLARHGAFLVAEAGVRGGGVPPRLALERLVIALAR